MVLQHQVVPMGKVHPSVPFRKSDTWVHFLLVGGEKSWLLSGFLPGVTWGFFDFLLYILSRGPVLPDASVRLRLGMYSRSCFPAGRQLCHVTSRCREAGHLAGQGPMYTWGFSALGWGFLFFYLMMTIWCSRRNKTHWVRIPGVSLMLLFSYCETLLKVPYFSSSIFFFLWWW